MIRKFQYILIISALTCSMAGCLEEETDEVFFTEEELLISDYLEEHEDEYATLIRVLEITNLKSTLNAYGHYTFFAPGDEAFAAFCESHGKATVEDFETDFLVTLVKYHLLNVEIESAYFRDGVIPDTTSSGDYLVVTFSEGGLTSIMVNDATISKRDIHVENGVIHKIDKVLDPIVGSVIDRLEESGYFSIFHDALVLTGIADSLDIISINLYKNVFIRSRFTLFVESDETYLQNGISTVNDLVSKYSDTGDPTNKADGLYRYVAYHVVPGFHYLNEIDTFNYPTLAENYLINIQLEDKIYINRQANDLNGQPISQTITVVEEESNQQAKNGAFHVIDNILEPAEPLPVYLYIDLTDYQGIHIGKTYTELEVESIRGISTDRTGIYYRNSILADGETNLQTTSEKVGWVIEFELPAVMRGRYDVYFHWASHPINTGWAQAFWDGARFGDTFSFVHQKRWPGVEWKRDYNTNQYLGRLILSETNAHKIRFVSLEDGFGNFDYLALWPVDD
ncbi:MAG: fasciclin domain-containing protein [Bacteroidales bacterium]